MNKTKVLVIGCAGQLGSDCMRVIEGSTGVDLPDIDIADCRRCVETLDRFRPEVIVNCAAYTAVDACESDPVCWKVNADGPANLAKWSKTHKAYLIHISTDYVFNGDKALCQPWIESDATGPVSEYGRSKLAGEKSIAETGADAAILRTAWLYGAQGANILKTMLRLALKDPAKEIRVVDDQFGSPTWSYTLARQIAAVIETRATGIYHAASEGYCTWYNLAARFLDLMGVPYQMSPCTTEEYPTPAKRPRNSILENAALKQLGINLFDNWERELERFVDRHHDKLLAEARR